MYNLEGKTFGELKVLCYSHSDKSKNRHFLCLCSCGRETIVRVDHLVYGNTKRCRFCRTQRAIKAREGKPNPLKGREQKHIKDLSGQDFNDLLVVERYNKNKSGEWVYRCVCICGNETFVSSTHLKSGAIKRCKSCGIKHMTQTKREQANQLPRNSVYPTDFSPELRRKIRKRDKFICQLCGTRPPRIAGFGLHVHHIDANKDNNDPMNLVSLCNKCHRRMFNEQEWVIYWRAYMKGKFNE